MYRTSQKVSHEHHFFSNIIIAYYLDIIMIQIPTTNYPISIGWVCTIWPKIILYNVYVHSFIPTTIWMIVLLYMTLILCALIRHYFDRKRWRSSSRLHLHPMKYTLSHPQNDRDVTDHAQGYTLQDASNYASIPIFFFEHVKKNYFRTRGEIMYRCRRSNKWLGLLYSNNNLAWIYGMVQYNHSVKATNCSIGTV